MNTTITTVVTILASNLKTLNCMVEQPVHWRTFGLEIGCGKCMSAGVLVALRCEPEA